MSKWLLNDVGDYAVLDGVAHHKVGSVQHTPTYALTTDDKTGLGEYTWNYDDSNVNAGTDHRTWSGPEMSAAQIPLYNGVRANHRTAVCAGGTPPSAAFMADEAGVFRFWGIHGNIQAYVNGAVYGTRRQCYDKADALAVKVLAGQAIQLERNDYSYCDSGDYIFMPYSYSGRSNNSSTVALVNRFDFDGIAGNTLQDKSPNNMNFAINGSPSIVAGKSGTALMFDADSKYAISQNNGFGSYGYFFGDYGFSWSMWVNGPFVADTSWRHFAVSVYGNGNNFTLGPLNKKLTFVLVESWSSRWLRMTQIAELPLNTWTHLGVAYDGKGRYGGLAGTKLYVNGQPITDLTYEGPGWNDTENMSPDYMAIGSHPSSSACSPNCAIDLYRMYSRALSDQEFLDIYNSEV